MAFHFRSVYDCTFVRGSGRHPADNCRAVPLTGVNRQNRFGRHQRSCARRSGFYCGRGSYRICLLFYWHLEMNSARGVVGERQLNWKGNQAGHCHKYKQRFHISGRGRVEVVVAGRWARRRPGR